jgi:ADP-heptose:LPS heptosyltransferase
LDVEVRDWRLEIRISGEDKAFASHELSAISEQPYVVLHPGSGGHSLARRWLLERWAQVGRALSERHSAPVVIVGTASDGGDELAAQLPSALNLTGKTSLPQLAALLQQCGLFIGADSGVMHIAAAAGAPVVALFGTTNVKAWGPWSPDGRCVVVQSETPGCPCAYVGFKIRSDTCEARECMKGIAVEKVLAAAESLLVR